MLERLLRWGTHLGISASLGASAVQAQEYYDGGRAALPVASANVPFSVRAQNLLAEIMAGSPYGTNTECMVKFTDEKMPAIAKKINKVHHDVVRLTQAPQNLIAHISDGSKAGDLVRVCGGWETHRKGKKKWRTYTHGGRANFYVDTAGVIYPVVNLGWTANGGNWMLFGDDLHLGPNSYHVENEGKTNLTQKQIEVNNFIYGKLSQLGALRTLAHAEVSFTPRNKTIYRTLQRDSTNKLTVAKLQRLTKGQPIGTIGRRTDGLCFDEEELPFLSPRVPNAAVSSGYLTQAAGFLQLQAACRAEIMLAQRLRAIGRALTRPELVLTEGSEGAPKPISEFSAPTFLYSIDQPRGQLPGRP